MIRRECPECRQFVLIVGGVIEVHARPNSEHLCESSWTFIRESSQPKPEPEPPKPEPEPVNQ
jgi:hypothetical protein